MKGILTETTVIDLGSGGTSTQRSLFFPNRHNLEISISPNGKVTVERIPSNVVLNMLGRRTLETAVEVPLTIIKMAEKILEDIDELNMEYQVVADLLGY